MRALTIWQPYASLVAMGHKRVETRSWPTSHRGMLAIHASVFRDDFLRQSHGTIQNLLRQRELRSLPAWEAMPFGAVVAVAELVYCVQFTAENFDQFSTLEHELGYIATGRFGWVLTAVRPLDRPVPCRGANGVWPLTEAIEQQVWRHVRRDVTHQGGEYVPRRQRQQTPDQPAPGQLTLDLWGVKAAAAQQAARNGQQRDD